MLSGVPFVFGFFFLYARNLIASKHEESISFNSKYF